MKFDIREVFENLSRKFKCDSNVTRITGALDEEFPTFMAILVLFNLVHL
jgi:hypothetical protein